MAPPQQRRPPQLRALFFIALLSLDGTLAGRVEEASRMNLALNRAAQSADASAGQMSSEAFHGSGDDDEERPTDSCAQNPEQCVAEQLQLVDPHKPILQSSWTSGQQWLDYFSSVTGLRGSSRDEFYAETVRKVLPERYIEDSAQFGLCVRTSSSESEVGEKSIQLRCTPAIELLPLTDEEKESTGSGDDQPRIALADVWKGLRTLVDEAKIPNINFSEDWMMNTWRGATNWITGKKDKFIEEQTIFDGRFSKYFDAEAEAVSWSFAKSYADNEMMQKLLGFDESIGASRVVFSGAIEDEWPGKYQPSMGSRYVICFGHLAKGNGNRALDPDKMSDQCTGFWNKYMTKAAIVGLGETLSWEDRYDRDRTLFRTRMEVLYGHSSASAMNKAFRMVGSGSMGSKELASTISKLVRERIAREGLNVDAKVAALLGSPRQTSNSSSLVQSAAATPWLNILPYSEGTWTLTLQNGALVSATQGTAGGVAAGGASAAGGAAAGGVVVAGVTVPPVLIVVGVIVGLYILKTLAKSARSYILTTRKLKKWRRLLESKAGARAGCFTSPRRWSTAGKRCPSA